MGFLWEDSTGARAVKMLRAMDPGTVIETPEFAMALGVDPGALHQLLANAVQLRYLKKIRGRSPCIGWTLGAGNDSATIERRKPRPEPTPAELERRRAASDRRRRRIDPDAAMATHAAQIAPLSWPPGFVSTFSSPELRYQPPRRVIDDAAPALEVDQPVPVWLRGLVGAPAPIAEPPAPPRPEQLPLFDPSEIGPGGRARWRRLDLSIPVHQAASNVPRWRQTTFLDA